MKKTNILDTPEEHVKKQSESGLSVKKYCESNGIKEHTFRYWQLKINRKKEKGNFKILKTNDLGNIPNIPIYKIIIPTRVEIEIYTLLDPAYFKELIKC